MTALFPFDNSYQRLPERFFARVTPGPVAAPGLVKLNAALATSLGLDPSRLASDEGVAVLGGNAVPAEADPIAQAYAGHQFGNFVPQLGDGRAILLGEIVTREQRRFDLQLKGSGRTPFSRMGDGRAALGPVLREYIVAEAMHALGIPTTRALAAVATGETVLRETPLPGAVLTRVAASHIRVGTFQFFAARDDTEALRLLLDHVIARHYPEAAQAESPALAVIAAVAEGQARLIARWLGIGFVHGVMNTDNCSIACETIDYGPCAFMDAYAPGAVFSSIDHGGRYAYANQPRIGMWNVARFAETLLPLIDAVPEAAIEQANAAVNPFADHFNAAYASVLRAKLGLASEEDGDLALAQELLSAMAASGADFTNTFRALCEAALGPAHDGPTRDEFTDRAAWESWAVRWRERLARDPASPEDRRAAMRAVNPAYIPRNHRVEAALKAAVEHGDFGAFETLVRVLARPFDDQPEHIAYRTPPLPDERVTRTFCGT